MISTNNSEKKQQMCKFRIIGLHMHHFSKTIIQVVNVGIGSLFPAPLLWISNIGFARQNDDDIALLWLKSNETIKDSIVLVLVMITI